MKKIIILGHENPDVDSIVSGYLLEKIMKQKGYNVEFVIPDKEISQETIDICIKNSLNPTKFQKTINLKDPNINYILVDHNQRKLEGKIICIIDHHPIINNIAFKNYYNTLASSTASYICKGNEFLLEKQDLKLAILATLIDTASFHSTKSREEDKIWAIDLCKTYNLDYSELYKQGLSITPINDLEKASLNGLKKYYIDNKQIESSYIQIKDLEKFETKLNIIIDILKQYVKEKELAAFIFIIHNMKHFKTTYYLITKNTIKVKNYDTYTSRGNTIIPEVKKILKK